jgi:hypothetical protein
MLRPPRSLVLVALLAAIALAAPAPAEAQLSNYSIGLEAGYANHQGLPVLPHVPVGLITTMFIESDFEAMVRFTMGFPAAERNNETQFYIRPALGMRYNLLNEQLRPQLIGEIAFFQYFGDASGVGSVFAAGGGAGLELFFAHDLSITLLGLYHRLLVFNGTDGNNLEAMLRFSSYF